LKPETRGAYAATPGRASKKLGRKQLPHLSAALKMSLEGSQCRAATWPTESGIGACRPMRVASGHLLGLRHRTWDEPAAQSNAVVQHFYFVLQHC
jgi:hypothetical protein